MLPRRNPDLEVSEFDGEFVVFDPRCMDVHLVSDVTAVVFDACDGTSSRTSLVDDLVELLDIDRSAADGMVSDSLVALERTGLLAGTASQLRPP